MNIVLLAGSPSANSRSTRLLHHIGERLALRGFGHSILQVRELPADALLHADFRAPAIQAAQEQIRLADALVVGTPIYQASYSGILKAFLDLLPQNSLAGKAVLPLATGGSQSHMLAIDYALRPVLSALGAAHILPGIYATEAQMKSPAEPAQAPGLILDAAIAERIASGIDHLAVSVEAARRRAPAGKEAAPILRSA